MEYAVVVPLLLTFVLGLIDTGRIFWSYTTLSRAVAAASRCAAINTTLCGTTLAIQSYAVDQSWGMGLTTTAFTVTAATCGTHVEGSMLFQYYTPWFYIAVPFGVNNTQILNASACYPI